MRILVDVKKLENAKVREARLKAMSRLPVLEEIGDGNYRSAVMPCAPFAEKLPHAVRH
ncbi:MAG: hypothetical protein ABJK25_12700 [Halieaceae bacterium]